MADTPDQATSPSAISNEIVLDPNAPAYAPSPATPLSGPQASAVKVTSADGGTAYTHDETLQGGKYVVEGQTVNALGLTINDKGERVGSDGKKLSPADAQAEQYALMGGIL